MRSSTAETVYAAEGYSVKSAGTEMTARVPLSNENIIWADIIFVMEEKHKVIIKTIFSDVAYKKNIIVLDIPDDYYFMEKELVELIKERVSPHLN
jgi:predicted protein tyrosine phosphatase